MNVTPYTEVMTVCLIVLRLILSLSFIAIYLFGSDGSAMASSNILITILATYV